MKGLDQFLDKIKASPRTTLISRYLSLVADLPSEQEKIDKALDLAAALVQSKPTETLRLAHMVHTADRYNLRAMDLMIEAMVVRGRPGKAEVLRLEKAKIENEMASSPHREPSRLLPEAIFIPQLDPDEDGESPGEEAGEKRPSPNDGGGAHGGAGLTPSAFAAAEVSRIAELDLSPSGSNLSESQHDMQSDPLARLFDGPFSEEPVVAAKVEGRPDMASIELRLDNLDLKTDHSPLDTVLPTPLPVSSASENLAPLAEAAMDLTPKEWDLHLFPEEKQGSNKSSERAKSPFQAQFQTTLSLEDGDAREEERQSTRITAIPVDHQPPMRALGKEEGLAPASAAATPAPKPRRLQLSLKSGSSHASPSASPSASPLPSMPAPQKEPNGPADKEPFDLRGKEPGFWSFVHGQLAQLAQPSKHKGHVQGQWSLPMAEAKRKEPSTSPSPLTPSSPRSNGGDRASLVRKNGSKPVTALAQEFHRHFRAIDGRMSDPEQALQEKWQWVQALWMNHPDLNVVELFENEGLTEATPGFFGVYLDALLVCGNSRKALYHLRRVLTRYPELTWARVAYRRLPLIFKMQRVRGFDWREDLGVPILLMYLNKRLEPTLEGLVAGVKDAG